MKRLLAVLFTLNLSLFALSAEDKTDSITEELKQIVDGKTGNKDGWEIFYLYNSTMLDLDIKRIYTGETTLEERSKDDKHRREYFLMLQSKLNLRRLVNGVLAHSQREKAKPEDIKRFINMLHNAKKKNIEYQNVYANIFGPGGSMGIMLGFYYDNILEYIILFAPQNEDMPTRYKFIPLVKFNYMKTGLVDDIKYELINPNKEINQEIERLWTERNIGIWLTHFPDLYHCAYLPMGMEKNMYSILEFRIMHLKSLLDYRMGSKADTMEFIDKKEKEYMRTGDNKLKENIDKLKASMPEDKSFENLRKKIKYFQDKLERKREKEKEKKGAGKETKADGQE